MINTSSRTLKEMLNIYKICYKSKTQDRTSMNGKTLKKQIKRDYSGRTGESSQVEKKLGFYTPPDLSGVFLEDNTGTCNAAINQGS
jgi:hypothetical protein